MSGAVLVSHVDGVQPTWQPQAELAAMHFSKPSLCSTPTSHFLFAPALATLRPVLADQQDSCDCEAGCSSSPDWVIGDVGSLRFRLSLIQKVLRFWQKGRSNSFFLFRISSGFLHRNSLAVAVKGDVLIHGPSLVARPVGSEWRNRRPFQVSNRTN